MTKNQLLKLSMEGFRMSKKAEEVKQTEVKAPKVSVKVAKPKYVKVKPKFTGKRCIGGIWYNFEKNKEIEVTEDAKRSLEKAGAIYL